MYNSLQAQLVSHFGHGSQFQALYTLSRTTGNVTLTGGENGVGDASVSDLTTPGWTTASPDAPAAHLQREPGAGAAVAGRQVGGRAGDIRRLGARHDRPGLVRHPVTVFDGDIPDLGNGISGTGPTANQRPNLVSGADCSASGGLKEQFLNPAAFTLVGIPFGTFGNSPRGIVLGPGLLPDRPGVLQEHPAWRARPGPVPLRDLQRVQPNFRIRHVAGPIATPTTRRRHGDLDTELPSRSARRGTRDPRQAQFGFKITF